MILLFNGLFQQQSLHATNLYDAVNDSVEYARDDSSRMSRGTFVINYPKFITRLNQYQIKDLPSNDQANYAVYLLKDNKSVDSNKGVGTYIFKHSKQYDENHPLYNSYINAKNYYDSKSRIKTYVAIRGIQVQVKKHREQLKGLINPSKASGKYIATFVVQESDTDPSFVENNDLRAKHHGNDKSANMPNYTHVKNGTATDNKKAFYKNQQSTYDLTTPSYPTEDKQ